MALVLFIFSQPALECLLDQKPSQVEKSAELWARSMFSAKGEGE